MYKNNLNKPVHLITSANGTKYFVRFPFMIFINSSFINNQEYFNFDIKPLTSRKRPEDTLAKSNFNYKTLDEAVQKAVDCLPSLKITRKPIRNIKTIKI